MTRIETLARLRNLPSVDEVMRAEAASLAVGRFGPGRPLRETGRLAVGVDELKHIHLVYAAAGKNV